VRRLAASLALAVASVLAVLGSAELAVRAFVPSARWSFEDGTGDWQIDDELGWVQQPNLDVSTQTPQGLVRFRTNADGLTPPEAQRRKPAGALRIMVFGDSFTVGRFVPQDEIYTARLEGLLRERGIPADVVNAGVQGYSTDQVLLLMQRWVPAYRPDVVLYGSTLNDLGGNGLERANGQAKPRFALDAHGRLRGSPPRISSAIQPLGTGPRSWIQRSALYRLVQPALFRLRARGAGLNERVLLGDLQEIYVRRAVVDALDWPLYGALVARMREVAEREGARFLFFEHPEVAEVWPPYIAMIRESFGVPEEAYDAFAVQRHLEATAAERGLAFVPTIQAFRDVESRGPFHLLPVDPHLNAAGHERLAEVLADAIAAPAAAPPR
jgi:lysophospholipase L1-like esterase